MKYVIISLWCLTLGCASNPQSMVICRRRNYAKHLNTVETRMLLEIVEAGQNVFSNEVPVRMDRVLIPEDYEVFVRRRRNVFVKEYLIDNGCQFARKVSLPRFTVRYVPERNRVRVYTTETPEIVTELNWEKQGRHLYRLLRPWESDQEEFEAAFGNPDEMEYGLFPSHASGSAAAGVNASSPGATLHNSRNSEPSNQPRK